MRSVIGAIVGIIISFMIGMVIIGTLINSVDRSGWSAQANSTWTSLINNVWTVFGLLVIIPLVVGAVVLLRMFSSREAGL